MILQSIKIESWRCFNRPVRIDFDPGVNIVHAPNGSGKSTLFEAIRCAFLEYSSAKNQSLKATVPWGCSVGPSVEICFTDQGEEYTLKKKFFQQSNSELFRKYGGTFNKQFESKSADEEVLRILNSGLDIDRLGSKEKWPLSQILLAPQGNLAIKDLSEDLKKNIRLAINAQLPNASSFDDAIEKKYLIYFSPKDGKRKTGKTAPAELAETERELAHTLSELEKTIAAYDEFEELSGQVAALRTKSKESQNHYQKQKDNLVILQDKQTQFEKLSNEKKTKELESENEKKSYESVDKNIKTIVDLMNKIRRTEGQIDDVSKSLPLKETESEDATIAFNKCNEQSLELKNIDQDLETFRLLIKDARSFVKTKSLLDSLIAKQKEAARLKDVINTKISDRSEIVAPDRETLNKIRELTGSLEKIREKKEASMLSIEITPERDLSLNVIEAEMTGTYDLSENELFKVQSSSSIVARIPGVATMRISGQSVSVEDDEKSLTRIQKELDEIGSPFPTMDIQELEKLVATAEQLDQLIETWKNDLKRELGSYDQGSLGGEIATRKGDFSDLIAKFPQWETDCPDPDAMEEEYGTKTNQLSEDRSEFGSIRDEVQRRFINAKNDLKGSQNKLKELKNELETLQKDLDKENEDGKTQEQRIEDRREILMRWDAAKEKLDNAVRDLKDFGENPQKEIEDLQELTTASEKRKDDDLGELQRTEGKLDIAVKRASYSDMIALQEKLDELQKRYDRELLRQDAVKLLRDTLSRCREKIFSGISEPVEKKATEIMKRIGGSKFSVVELKQDFIPQKVLPDVSSDSVSIQNISEGENEQLHFAVRIALAETLIKDERHFMLLDDILTATDSDRMGRVLGILGELRERFQVIVLTCHPERYKKLSSGKFIDLRVA